MRNTEATISDLRDRITSLERAGRRHRVLATGAGLVMLGALCLSAKRGVEDLQVGTLTAEHIVVIDGEGRPRLVLGEDPADTQRRSRSSGLTLLDDTGSERGGFATMEDGSVVLGMDSPAGVGAAMRDRIGLVVSPDGSARIDLIDNQTRLVVRLVSETPGTGGIEFFEYDTEAREVTVTRIDENDRQQRTISLGG